MSYDIAILYFGLTRSAKLVYNTHKHHILDVLNDTGYTYKIFLHTWNTHSGKQNVWDSVIDAPIDNSDHEYLSPDYFQRDNEDEFVKTIDDATYWQDAPIWPYYLVKNHLCMLESQSRVFEMMKISGIKFKKVMFIRPDINVMSDFPVHDIFSSGDADILVPSHNNYHGINDQLAIMSMSNAEKYGCRKNELLEYKQNVNNILVAEQYCQYIINKYGNYVPISFIYQIVRP